MTVKMVRTMGYFTISTVSCAFPDSVLPSSVWYIDSGTVLPNAMPSPCCEYCATKRGFQNGRCLSCGAPEP
jgi:hypothetical protein